MDSGIIRTVTIADLEEITSLDADCFLKQRQHPERPSSGDNNPTITIFGYWKRMPKSSLSSMDLSPNGGEPNNNNRQQIDEKVHRVCQGGRKNGCDSHLQRGKDNFL